MTQTTLRFRRIASRTLGIASTLGFIAAASCSAEDPENVGTKKSSLSPNGIVIAEVYGGGGNAGAPYKADFVLLFNQGTSAASLNGMFLQYQSAASNFVGTLAVALNNVTIQPGKYYLVQMSAAGTTGADLPAPDQTVTPAIAMGAGAGKVMLTTAALDACGATGTPCTTNISDLVGYGSGVSQVEGSGATPAPSATLSAHRKGGGCLDTDQNATDFETGAPTPKNSATAANLCSASDSGSGGTGGTDAATGGTGGTDAATGGTGGTDAATGGAGGTDASTGGTGGGPVDAGAPPVGLVIAEVYGAAGPSGLVQADYAVIFNRGTAPASLENVHVLYGSATGNFGSFAGNIASLPNVMLGAGQYFLVAGNAADGGGGAALPTPDDTFIDANFSSTSGKVVLVHGAPITCGGDAGACGGAGLLDLVGYGTNVSQFEGSSAGPGMTATTAVVRKLGGCQDTDQNGNDFEAVAPAPKNTSSPLNDCSALPDSGTGGSAGAGTGGTAGAATGGTAGAATGGTGGGTGGSGATGGGATGGTSSGGTGGNKDGGVGNIGGFAGKPAAGSNDDGGCGCETPGNAQNSSGIALLSLLGLAAFARRRRS